MDYKPDKFKGTYENENGKEIFKFLISDENRIRMETSSYLGNPAVTPLSDGLLEKFGEKIRQDRVKQMIGHMTRQIMESYGYIIDQSNVKITISGNIFYSGTRYTRRDK